jgi:hypothetical protein
MLRKRSEGGSVPMIRLDIITRSGRFGRMHFSGSSQACPSPPDEPPAPPSRFTGGYGASINDNETSNEH